MDDIKSMMLGINVHNELFNLWYEVSFLRNCLNAILSQNPNIYNNFTKEKIDECRKNAQQEVQERFPVCKIDFSEITPEMIDKKRESLENLKKFNKLMGGMFGPVNE